MSRAPRASRISPPRPAAPPRRRCSGSMGLPEHRAHRHGRLRRRHAQISAPPSGAAPDARRRLRQDGEARGGPSRSPFGAEPRRRRRTRAPARPASAAPRGRRRGGAAAASAGAAMAALDAPLGPGVRREHRRGRARRGARAALGRHCRRRRALRPRRHSSRPCRARDARAILILGGTARRPRSRARSWNGSATGFASSPRSPGAPRARRPSPAPCASAGSAAPTGLQPISPRERIRSSSTRRIPSPPRSRATRGLRRRRRPCRASSSSGRRGARQPGDRWIEVADAAAAARAVGAPRRGAPFSPSARARSGRIRGPRRRPLRRPPDRAAARTICPWPTPVLVIARPPFTLDDERQLLQRHAIEVVVAKASGGALTGEARGGARGRDPGGVMVNARRPSLGLRPRSVDEAVAWVAGQDRAMRRGR